MIVFPTIILVLLLVIFGIPGVVLIWIGSTGTYTGDTCTCGYDLTRLPPDSTRCPECGMPRRHVTVRKPKMIVVGLVLLLLPFALVLLAIGALFYRFVM